MGCGALKVTCEDGFEIVSKDQKELVTMTQHHVKNTHHKDISHEEVMKMAKHP
jgi:predicted small metal-binding protein